MMTFTLNTYSQQARIADLKVSIVSPLVNSSIKSPGTLLVKFSVFNKGPDALKPNDTIRFYPISNDTLFKRRTVYCSKITLAGDSEIFSTTIPFNAPYDNNYYSLGISTLGAINRSPDSLRSESLKMQNDNSSYITVKHRSATSFVENILIKNQVNIYPNPANAFVNFKFDENASGYKIELCNLKGQILRASQSSNFNKNESMSTMDIPAGVYIVKFSNAICSFYGKLNIIH